ncbi:hypothetical protein NQ317_015485 [Molorchus minor]|uniref:HIT domain-containing protein n=1 Tax=Molorchus minor TaxID=1323400 RepID=A0ABQ9IRX5_9CUCU|nr:hypothetical protein NQ317_015485 [Molorchus minor]
MPKRKLSEGEHPEKFKTSGHWSLGLLKTMEDPKFIVQSDNLTTVIKDAYPKAEFHYLVLPKQNLSNLKEITKEHITLLEHMDRVAKELITDHKHKSKTFKIGYHAEASMFRLHLHVISDDMNSICLKTKKHWNSFNSDFFLKSSDILLDVKEHGKVILPSKDACKKYMELPLKCHKCDYKPKKYPRLKKTHFKTFEIKFKYRLVLLKFGRCLD